MTTMVRRSVPLMLAAFLVVGVFCGVGQAQDVKTAALAKELVQLMDAAKMDSIAAKFPGEPDGYVAALYFPGQLLVVKAKYQPAVLLTERLTKKEYREIYSDLNSASVAGSRIFVMDVGADGMRPKKDEGRLDTCDLDAKTIQFDGEWKKAKMQEEEYMKAFADAEEKYAAMLTALLAQAKKGS